MQLCTMVIGNDLVKISHAWGIRLAQDSVSHARRRGNASSPTIRNNLEDFVLLDSAAVAAAVPADGLRSLVQLQKH